MIHPFQPSETVPVRAPQGSFLDLSLVLVLTVYAVTYGILPSFLQGLPAVYYLLPHLLLPLPLVFLCAVFCDGNVTIRQKLPFFVPRPFPARLTVSFFLFLYVFTMILSSAVKWIASLLSIDLPPQNVIQFLLQADPVTFTVMAFSSVILAPLTEEVLFRHLLFSKLSYHIPEWCAAVLTAAVFALLHGSLLHGLSLFAMSLILQCAYRCTGTLLIPVILHSSFNFMSVFFLFFLKQ